MARLTGPLHSLAASGTIANLLTFGTTAGRHVARKKPHHDPTPSPHQRANRELLKWLGNQWRDGLSPAEQATWSTRPEAQRTSDYAAYLAENRGRLNQGLRPIVSYPGTAAAVAFAFAALPSVVGLTQAIGIDYTLTTINGGWGVYLHMSKTNNFTPTNATIVAIFQPTTGGPKRFTARDIEPGIWFCRMRRARRTGGLSSLNLQQTIQVF